MSGVTFILPAASRTESGVSGSENVSKFTEINLLWDVTALSGSGVTSSAEIETSADGTNWFPQTGVGNFAAVLKFKTVLTQFGSFIRINFTIPGTTPSITFSVAL